MLVTVLMLLFAIFLLFFVLPFSILWFFSIVGSGAPFVPVPSKAVAGIVQALKIGESEGRETGTGQAPSVHRNRVVVYDMGCGDGRVLFAAVRANPNIRAIGIEKALLPYLIARIRAWFATPSPRRGEGRGEGKRHSVTLCRADFFSLDLSDATHVVMYLFPPLMKKVERKLEQELLPGTRIVAIDFPFPSRRPIEIIEQKIKGLKRGTKLYIYEI